MKEKEISTIINNNFKTIGFSHKIADPLGGTGIQNPFDGFSVFKGMPIYWEIKRLVDYQAFNFKKIKEHQINNLRLIKNLLPSALCLIILAIWKKRRFLDLYLFDIDYIIYNQEVLNKKSLLKKELLMLKENNEYLLVKNKKFNIDNLLNKMVNYNGKK